MRRLPWLLILLLGCDAEAPAPAPTPTPVRTADARPKPKQTKTKRATRKPTPTPTSIANPTPSPTAAPAGPPIRPLSLTHDGKGAIANRLELTIRENDLRRIEESKVKFDLAFPEVTFNGERIPLSEVKLRGQTAIEFPRKSFSVKLSSKVEVRQGARTAKLKRFYLSALATDAGYFRASISFDLLRRMKRFPVFTAFAEVRLNGRSFGPYLLLERPVDALVKRGKAVMVARRRLNHIEGNGRLAPKRTPMTGLQILARWEAVKRDLGPKGGEALRSALADAFDLPGLLTWVGIDVLVHNSDPGQAYLIAYPEGDRVRFDLLPWDYDRSFWPKISRDHPHPWAHRHRFPETLIRRDPGLFAAYRERLRELGAWMEGPEPRAVFEATFQALAPYYADPEVIANAKRDRGKRTLTLKSLEAMLQAEYAALVRRARSVR